MNARAPASVVSVVPSFNVIEWLSLADQPLCVLKTNSAILVMKAAEDGRMYDAAHVLDGAMDRSVLLERSMSPQLVIVGGIPR